MKTWKKGAIIGAVWGLVADIIYMTSSIAPTQILLKFIVSILVLPLRLTVLFGKIGFPGFYYVFLYSIFIGAILGGIAGKLLNIFFRGGE